MKNLFKSLAAVATIAFMVAACNVENLHETYTPTCGPEVTFMQETIVATELSADATTFTIDLARVDASSAQTVNLDLKNVPAGVKCPSSVSFAAGEYQAALVMDISTLEVGQTLKGKIALADVSLSNKNISTVETTFTIAKAYIWEPYGTGNYVYTQYWEGVDPGLTIDHAVNTNVYRINNWGGGISMMFEWDKATNACVVYDQFTGYVHSSYGELWVAEQEIYWPGDETNDHSFYDPSSKTFYFGVVLYVSAGYFGYGYEEFHLD